MLRFLLRLLFPGRLLTDDDASALAALKDRSPIVIQSVELRRLGMPSIDRVIAAQSYDESPIIKTLLWKWKYKHMTVLAAEFQRLLLRAAEKIGGDAVLCPVPLHWTRRFARGFNQAEVLARAVSDEWGLPVHSLLKRVRSTGYQSHRNRAERLTAVADAFVAVGPMPAHVVLIDDVVTTGSTLQECAKALKQAGVKRIEAVVVARG